MTVHPYLVRNSAKIAWNWHTHNDIGTMNRPKRSSSDYRTGDEIKILLDGRGISKLNLNLRPKRHPVTSETIIEWISEDGQRTISRADSTDHCWYSGHVDDQTDSLVSLGVCEGLQGVIRYKNETLLLEPLSPADGTDQSVIHILYSMALPKDVSLDQDQDYGHGELRKTRRKRESVHNQIDYDEEGNEIINTIHSDGLPDYHQTEDDDDEEYDLSLIHI